MKIPNFLDPEDINSIKAANLNPNGPFYFISHGYVESGDRVWVSWLIFMNSSNFIDNFIIQISFRSKK